MKRKQSSRSRNALIWLLAAVVFCFGATAAFAEEADTAAAEIGIVKAEASSESGTVSETNQSTTANDASQSSSETSTGTVSAASSSSSVTVDPNAMTFSGTVKYKDDAKPVDNSEFSYVLKKKNTNGDFEQKDIVFNDSQGNYAFSSVSETTAGTYEYTVSQVTPTKSYTDQSNFKFDETVYTIKVTVEGSGSTLSAKAVITASDSAVSTTTASSTVQLLDTATTTDQSTSSTVTGIDKLDFTNTYSGTVAYTQLKAKKTLSGKTLQKDEFSFNLYKLSEDNVIKQTEGTFVETVKNDASGNVVFASLPLDTTGVYYYRIVEDTSTKETGVTYDTTKYLAVVTVAPTGTNGKMNSVISYIKEASFSSLADITAASPVDSVSFANSYKATSTSSGTTTKSSTTTTPTSSTANKSNTNKASTAGTAKTGDGTPIGLCVVLFAGFAAGLAGITVVSLRRKKTGEKQE